MNILLWQITLLSVLAVIVILTAVTAPNAGLGTLVNVTHIFACALWLGASAWEAVFRGLVMLQSMPRHAFGLAQGKVFPVLFQFGNVCSGIAVMTFLYQHPPATLKHDPTDKFQALILLGTILGSVVNSVILVPRGTEIMWTCHKIEREAGVGETVRYLDMKPLEGNEAYHDLRSRFFIYHSLSQATAVLSCACVAYRIAFLATRIASI